jgi:hypothetical protein
MEWKKEKITQQISGEGDEFCFGEVFREGRLDFGA